MIVISKITTQQKNSDRYNIFINDGKGEKYGFSVDEAVLIKFNLKKGMPLPDELLEEINFEDSIRKALNRAINYLAIRMRSEGEVRQHLMKNEFGEVHINEVIAKLRNMNYLDDEQFAKAYVNTQVRTTDKGYLVIRRELAEKGVPEQIITRVMEVISKEEEIEKATLIAEKYIAKNKRYSKQSVTNKTRQLLMRKGYRSDIIRIAVEEALLQFDEDGEMEALRNHGEKAKRRFKGLEKFEHEQKMKQTLYRRGFPLELIERFLLESEEDE